MDFNLILDELPDSFDGCPVNTDFRQCLRFFAVLANKSLDENDRAAIIVRLFFPVKLPQDANRIWKFIEFFIGGGEVKGEESSGPAAFDINVDAGRLYSAFLQTYRIDLREEKMHWWKFLELFRDLPDDTMLLKIMETRTKKAPKYADEEYKAALRKAKAAFAIDKPEERAANLGSTLMSWAGG